MAVFIKFWGTRGSVPTPGARTRVYGGNTSCVELRWNDTLFICDAGSGIRELGIDLMQRSRESLEAHLFFTHPHWDHIQGFPFFAPAYLPDSRIHVYGPETGNDRVYQLLSGQMKSPYFPVDFGELGANIQCEFLDGGSRRIAGVTVSSFELNHPGGCHGYSFAREGRRIVYATDCELEPGPGDVLPDREHQGGLRQVPDALIEVASGADLLIMDAQYTDEEYLERRGWGHSSCLTVTDLAIQAGVKQLALFHHDPGTRDGEIDERVLTCRTRAALFDSNLEVFAAREGVELKL